MNIDWAAPKMIEITLEEAVELADLSIACATLTKPAGGPNPDHM
jgi:hypothetical protein